MNISELISQTLIKNLSDEQRKSLCEASHNLSKRYREKNYGLEALTQIERYAYILVRMPATFAAISAVMSEISRQIPNFAPRSMIDIGAGPGTASLSAAEYFESLSDYVLLEKDSEWISLSKKIASAHQALAKGTWLLQDMSKEISINSADLIVAAYSFQELALDHHERLITKLFESTNEALVIIEPGTPKGFAHIQKLRTKLISLKAQVIAPCTHTLGCPLSSNDWCHFSTRLNRHELHRQTKSASLGYEDEKYSYLIVTKSKTKSLDARVLRKPLVRSGHIILDLCAEGQQKREVIARSEKLRFRAAKKTEWGSLWSGI